MAPHRDPETGQFLSGHAPRREWADIEVVTFGTETGVPAARLEGGTNYGDADQAVIEGSLLIDYDEVCDRNEELHLLEAQHRLSVWQNSTATEDGSIRVYVELSTSSVLELAEVSNVDANDNLDGDSTKGQEAPVGQSESDDTIDVIGRPLAATGHGGFYNAANGAGGSGSAGEDSYESDYFPGEYGRFHPRDELNLNFYADISNIDDAGIHIDVVGQHVYGVVEHDH